MFRCGSGRSELHRGDNAVSCRWMIRRSHPSPPHGLLHCLPKGTFGPGDRYRSALGTALRCVENEGMKTILIDLNPTDYNATERYGNRSQS